MNKQNKHIQRRLVFTRGKEGVRWGRMKWVIGVNGMVMDGN